MVVSIREPLQDFLLGRRIGITHLDAHQKSIQLRFRQRIRSMVFDRILRRQNHERAGKRIRDVLDRHLALVHRLQKRTLSLWRRSIDLIR